MEDLQKYFRAEVQGKKQSILNYSFQLKLLNGLMNSNEWSCDWKLNAKNGMGKCFEMELLDGKFNWQSEKTHEARDANLFFFHTHSSCT
jgi:hypothetical protein